ncbi:MAG TPA: hypothetical protein PKC91_04295, partial [Ignavibacteria bacterium]|nr:hypothetical protein [Ignavibacteria bacterium]
KAQIVSRRKRGMFNAESADSLTQKAQNFFFFCVFSGNHFADSASYFAINKNVFIKLYFYYFKIELKGVNADAGRE